MSWWYRIEGPRRAGGRLVWRSSECENAPDLLHAVRRAETLGWQLQARPTPTTLDEVRCTHATRELTEEELITYADYHARGPEESLMVSMGTATDNRTKP